MHLIIAFKNILFEKIYFVFLSIVSNPPVSGAEQASCSFLSFSSVWSLELFLVVFTNSFKSGRGLASSQMDTRTDPSGWSTKNRIKMVTTPALNFRSGRNSGPQNLLNSSASYRDTKLSTSQSVLSVLTLPTPPLCFFSILNLKTSLITRLTYSLSYLSTPGEHSVHRNRSSNRFKCATSAFQLSILISMLDNSGKMPHSISISLSRSLSALPQFNSYFQFTRLFIFWWLVIYFFF